MSNKKLIIGTSVLVAVILAGAFSVSQAYRGDYLQKGPNYTPERHEAMTKAFESNDYQAWKKLMEQNQFRGRVMDVVNEGNFARFTQMHRLMVEGKYEEANQIRAELGLRTRDGQGAGYGQGMRDGRGQGRGNGSGCGQSFTDANNDGVCDRLQ
ncbi:MAG: hypothetical protein UR69_C0004G0022 [Candidatus Moranbacteria bacterium GW2011_GWE2_35_2-]|nr:MAG: hypothetical protein UR69_C0004G0022 [Candidatus Moranbacteria bacterium GW2011_GWE2_35_2-]KKQ04959.1 MAG: hypothetical protein US15_C0038G0002 [Candidatus Moranbacteria bacterium GW2011_GWF1_36_4]KKQ22196.1 MAG: hypothetical protein US37_C0003G0022 [Candidatus Moranbacteria bacterium GW2011_GWF2_37_11]KKQ28748.1 MAG: hypothetical protein US44_C0007G0034 [Candidatus Moranbacteria bacterium GW2011_GWD1_37_17]KKQ30312.1 MAG: hypothetical protein US47_C0003G0107 [Candidatus Moranbacteria b